MKTFYFFMAVVFFFISAALSVLFYLFGDMDACCGWGVSAVYAIGVVIQRYKEAL